MLKMIEDICFLGAKPVSTPIDPHMKLSSTEGTSLKDPSSYPKLIGRLFYLTNTRPNVSFVVHHLGQYVDNPLVPHYQAATRVLKYLKEFSALGIFSQ